MRLLDEDQPEARTVAVTARALPLVDDTRHAFDAVAAVYDRANARNPTLCAMRRRSLAAFTEHVPAGSRVLDLGCGPGTDEEALVAAGYTVTAIDCSPAMVEEARRRVTRSSLEDRVEVRQLGIQELDRLAPAMFDAALSNFGPLNCVPNLAETARIIGKRLRPGGVLVASVIGRVCPWELALYASRREWARLRVRFRPTFVAVPLAGRTVWTRYYAPRAFERAFAAAGFARVSLRGLGLFVPPPYMEAFSARHSGLVATLQAVEDRLGGLFPFRYWGDHFLIVLKR
jgi:SAM-dependent methyltransferase